MKGFVDGIGGDGWFGGDSFGINIGMCVVFDLYFWKNVFGGM